MTQQTTTRKLSVGARLAMLALVVMMLLGVALAAPTRLNAQSALNANEMLVFDWNKPVLKSHSGFAQYKPLSAFPQFPNGNWISPINWTNGTLYFRVKVLSIPQNQPKMKLGFCFWQNAPHYGEECTKNYALAGVPGNEGRWSQSFQSMSVIHNAPIAWALPRWKEGFVVRHGKTPVSGKLDFHWAGQNPDHWYPLNIHYTVVLVVGGGEPDWTQYGWPNN